MRCSLDRCNYAKHIVFNTTICSTHSSWDVDRKQMYALVHSYSNLIFFFRRAITRWNHLKQSFSTTTCQLMNGSVISYTKMFSEGLLLFITIRGANKQQQTTYEMANVTNNSYDKTKTSVTTRKRARDLASSEYCHIIHWCGSRITCLIAGFCHVHGFQRRRQSIKDVRTHPQIFL